MVTRDEVVDKYTVNLKNKKSEIKAWEDFLEYYNQNENFDCDNVNFVPNAIGTKGKLTITFDKVYGCLNVSSESSVYCHTYDILIYIDKKISSLKAEAKDYERKLEFYSNFCDDFNKAMDDIYKMAKSKYGVAEWEVEHFIKNEYSPEFVKYD